MEHKEHHKVNSNLRDVILGGQDGLVNVLGIVLAIATATKDINVIIIAGLAATFAESISMAAVAYTSSRAAKDYYLGMKKQEVKEIKDMPRVEIEEVRKIYYSKGFRGNLLEKIVKKITSNRDLWLDTMMKEELQMSPEEYKNPVRNAVIVGVSALIGSLIPLLGFFFLDISSAIIFSLTISSIALFITGTVKAKLTIGNWLKSGIEMFIVGMVAAITGYLIGYLLGAVQI